MSERLGRSLGAMGWAACAAALLLGAANASVAFQVFQAGGGVDPELTGQAAALLSASGWLLAARVAPAGLALTVVSLWVYWGLAPVVGQVVTGPPEELPLWIGPMELLAFGFFPLAFFAWRGLVHRDAALDDPDD